MKVMIHNDDGIARNTRILSDSGQNLGALFNITAVNIRIAAGEPVRVDAQFLDPALRLDGELAISVAVLSRLAEELGYRLVPGAPAVGLQEGL